jgi:hypothetical protein
MQVRFWVGSNFESRYSCGGSMEWAYALESGQVPGLSLGSNFTVSEVTQRSVVGCHAGEIVVRGTVSSTGSVDGLWSDRKSRVERVPNRVHSVTVVSGSWVQRRRSEKAYALGRQGSVSVVGLGRVCSMVLYARFGSFGLVPRSRRALGSCSGRLDRCRAWKPTKVPLDTNQSERRAKTNFSNWRCLECGMRTLQMRNGMSNLQKWVLI